MGETFDQVKEKLGAAFLPMINEVLSAMMRMADWMMSHWGEIRDYLANIWGAISAGFKDFMGNLEALWNAVWPQIRDFVIPVLQYIWDFFKTALQGIYDFGKAILDLFMGHWSAAWNAVKNLFSTIWDGIKTLFVDYLEIMKGLFVTWLNFARDIWGTIWNGIKAVFVTIWDDIKSIFTGAWDGMKSVWNDASNWIGGIGDKIVGFFDDAITWLYQAGKDVLTGFWNGIKAVWHDVTKWFSSIGSSIANFFTGGTGNTGTSPNSAGNTAGHTPGGDEEGGLVGQMSKHLLDSGGGGKGVVDFAKKYLGAKYNVGSHGPDEFDCSGFAGWVYQHNGLPGFPTYTGNQDTIGTKVTDSSMKGAAGMLQAGDLVFLVTGDKQFTDHRGFGHVGIYEGNGTVISATGHARGVAEDPLSSWGVWEGRRYSGLRSTATSLPASLVGALSGLAGSIGALKGLGALQFDSGGYLPPGLTLAINGTGSPERVVGPGGGGDSYHLHIYTQAPQENIIQDFNFLKAMNTRAS